MEVGFNHVVNSYATLTLVFLLISSFKILIPSSECLRFRNYFFFVFFGLVPLSLHLFFLCLLPVFQIPVIL
jgi:hypothetical protein